MFQDASSDAASVAIASGIRRVRSERLIRKGSVLDDEAISVVLSSNRRGVGMTVLD